MAAEYVGGADRAGIVGDGKAVQAYLPYRKGMYGVVQTEDA